MVRFINILLASALALLACESSVPVPPITWEGRYIAYGTDVTDRTACGAHPRFEDTFFGLMGEALGEALPDEQIEYFWLTPESYELTDCPPLSVGCFNARDKRAYTLYMPAEHELVHAVVRQAGINTHVFLDEGLAVLFGETSSNVFRPDPDVSIMDGFTFSGPRRDTPPELYGRAGHFVRFLVDEFGMEATVALMRAVTHGESPESIDADFLAVLGLGLGEVEALYSEVPECGSDEFRIPLMECQAPPMYEKLGYHSLYPTLRCEDEDVLGPSHAGEVYTTRTFEIDVESEDYRIKATNIYDAAEWTVTVGRCEGGCESGEPRRYDADSNDHKIHLRPGRYYLTASREGGQDGQLGVVITPP